MLWNINNNTSHRFELEIEDQKKKWDRLDHSTAEINKNSKSCQAVTSGGEAFHSWYVIKQGSRNHISLLTNTLCTPGSEYADGFPCSDYRFDGFWPIATAGQHLGGWRINYKQSSRLSGLVKLWPAVTWHTCQETYNGWYATEPNQIV